MEQLRATSAILAPMLLWAVSATVPAARADDASTASPFALDPSELDPIRYTRLPEDEALSLPLGGAPAQHRTEFSFSLSPQRPDFSRAGAYGLGMLFGRPEIAMAEAPPAPGRGTGERSISPRSVLNDGFRYSAGVRIEHEDADIDGTAYVSSSLLGLSYGRLGRLWYGGIDVNLERFADERHGEEQPDVLSLDVTTGRRLGITGLGAGSPLWLLSLRGDFDLLEADASASREAEPSWFLNPSLFWEHPGFTFSAQMQVPVDTEPSTDEEEGAAPDYRLRAVFEKRFK